MATALNTIMSWFETGDYPTQEQFQNSWSSFWHKDEKLPMTSITNLETSLQNKVDKSIYNTHLTSADSHATTLAKLDGSNLNYLNTEAWKTALGVGELPSNIALIDDPINTLQGNVWTKAQSNALYMLLEDFVISGKIRADKIEAIGLTELISVTETSLSAFITNNANYQYEKNDFIAIPNGSGNYSLYIFKGGAKTVSSNYLPTGLTTITIAMVEGLQTALDNKLDKPTGTGSFIVTKNGTVSGYRQINTASNYLLFWNNTDFTASEIYRSSGKYGIGTTTPSEMLHLNDGRLRSKAIVFDDNIEMLPGQITYYNRRFRGTDATSIARNFMYADFLDYKALWEGFTDAQKNEIKSISNGGWVTGTMSVALITPPVVDKTDKNTWISLKGAGLNFNPANFSVKLISFDETVELSTIPNNQVQLYANGIDLTFYFNFKDIPLGTYKVKLWNGVSEYKTGANTTIKVVQSLSAISLNQLTWETKTFTPNSPNVITATGGAVSYSATSANKAFSRENVVVASGKSSKLIEAGQDFTMTGTIRLRDGTNSLANVTVGFMNPATVLSLANASLFQISFNCNNTGNNSKVFMVDSTNILYTPNDINSSGTFSISRSGGLYTVLIQYAGQSIVSSKSGTTEALSLATFFNNSPATDNGSSDAGFSIQNCYVF